MPFKISVVFLPTLNPLLSSLCCKFVTHSLLKKTCARCCVSQRGKEKNDGFRLGVQDFPFWGRSRIARSLGFRVSDTKRHIVPSSCRSTILSDSRCYGYVLSHPRAIFISHIHVKSVTRVLRSKSSMKKSFVDHLYLAIIEK